MPIIATRRLAGFHFEVQPPPLLEKLPRMDIAVFVGFAAAGPLDTPVLVEDTARFAQIFGDDVPLAWDAANGQMNYAHLGGAVRHFFLNGGQRCWVIRVAKGSETNLFPLPGVLESDSQDLRPAFARARSSGSWFDRFGSATALTTQIIPVAGLPVGGETIAQLRSGTELAAGDLLRFRLPNDGLEAFAVVQNLGPAVESPPQPRSRSFVIRTSQLHWFSLADPESIASIPCLATWFRRPETEAAPLVAVALLQGRLASPPASLATGQLRLEVANESSPPGFSFAPPPATWLELDTGTASLWFMVDDVQSIGKSEASPTEGTTSILGRAYWVVTTPPPLSPNADVIVERLTFEIHARAAEAEALRILELGFAWPHPRAWSALPDDTELFATDEAPAQSLEADSSHEALVLEAKENPTAGARFPLAGPANRKAVYFPLLVPSLPQPFLPAVHSDRDELDRSGLARFGSDLFLDPDLVEASAETLVAESDFIQFQQRQPRALRGIHAALGIEEATLIAVPDAVHSGWELAPATAAPAPQRSAPLPHPSWGLSEQCGFEPSPPVGVEPRYDKFLDCALRKLIPPSLVLAVPPDALGTFTLEWTSLDAEVRFVLEEAGRPDFSDSVVIFQGSQKERPFQGKPSGTYYYRVRSIAAEETSNWSNEIGVTVPPRVQYNMRDGNEAGLAPLLDIHRSVLRLAAARGDLLAILALPQGFQTDDARDYLKLLRAAQTGADDTTTTLPFDQGETRALSFGAVYHPWIITRESDGLLYSPPDGAATGIIARRSLERGAWIAPANELFRTVLALTPRLGDGRRLDLLLDQLNQITQEPAGFMTLNQDTLSNDPEVRPINVRRLLILLRRAALRLGATYVFESNGPALRRLVQHAFESMLDQLFVRGAFAGATRSTSFEVVTDDSINTPASLALARFRVDLKVAPSQPMSFVTVRLVQIGESGITTEVL